MTGKKTAAALFVGGHDMWMQSRISRQFLLLVGHTVLWHMLQTFSGSGIDEIVLATPQGEAGALYRTYQGEYGFRKSAVAVEGGAECYDSAVAGPHALLGRGTELIFIYDATHPFVSQGPPRRMRDAGERYGATILALSAKGMIKLGNTKSLVQDTPLRALLFVAQTPQVFSYTVICAAYETHDRMRRAEDAHALLATDGAQVIERFGACPVKPVEGGEQNQKLTTPEGVARAEPWLWEYGAK